MIPLPDRDRVGLLRVLLGFPEEASARNVELARRERPRFRRLDFEDIFEALRQESDAVVRQLRMWRPR